MKKIEILLLLSVMTSILLAQEKFTEFQGGILMPEAAKTGFWGGLSFGRLVDDNVGWAFEVDYYGKTYKKETTVELSEGLAQPQRVITEIENSSRMIPVFFKLAFLSQVSPIFDLRLSGGIGWEFMWNNETSFEFNTDKTRFYHGFAWQAAAGLSVPISRSSDLFGEVAYHSGKPSRDEGETDEGLPVRTEVDMSGLAFRIGLRLYTFGF